ncbi:unnamed protein product [Closterium sp. Yama58-4]|nr:unnamed protein product [Closterium sp. Yama58-4]
MLAVRPSVIASPTQLHSVGCTSHLRRHVAPLTPITSHHRATLISWSSSAFPRRSWPLRGPSLHCQQPQHLCSLDSTHSTHGSQGARTVRPRAATAGQEEDSFSRSARSDGQSSGGGGLGGKQEGRLAGRQEGRGVEMRQGRGMDKGMQVRMFTEDLPTQMEAITTGATTLVTEVKRSPPDVDYLQELLAIQQSGPRNIGFFGTRNMGFMHQQLIEILSYAMIITNNHIYTSGAAGTNAAVIRGALRAEKAELLTVILPQSLGKQPPESQELLKKVENLVEKPHNDHLPLLEASRLCNMDILSEVEHVICFAFHDSRLLMETNIELLDPNEELPSAKVTQGRTLGVAGPAASGRAGLGLGLGAGLALKLETDVMVRFGSHSTFCDAVKALARHAVKKEGSSSLARVQLEIDGGDYFDERNVRRRRFTREQRAEEERQLREREERRRAERERAERERKEEEERKAREEEERVRR